MVPASWDRNIPSEDFLAKSCRGTELETRIEALPGICSGGSPHLLVCVRNESPEEAVVVRGLPLLRAVETIAALAGRGAASDPEVRAMAALKQGDYRPEIVFGVL